MSTNLFQPRSADEIYVQLRVLAKKFREDLDLLIERTARRDQDLMDLQLAELERCLVCYFYGTRSEKKIKETVAKRGKFKASSARRKRGFAESN